MEKYTVLETLGEGSYGKVLKCRHNESGALVAIKKFIETEEDSSARKVALREIRMLKKLHHPNLVCLLEVFRRKKRFHLVFEYMSCTLLEELEARGKLPDEQARRYIYQVLRGLHYCHSHNIIHRDIKPENILLSELGVVKLCDFGFARFTGSSTEPYTDYVATRWYRPPELLVGEPNYGRPVDIWALGCILIEMVTGDALFPGNSDIDQLFLITKLLGGLTESQKMLMSRQKLGLQELGRTEEIKSWRRLDALACLSEAFPDLPKNLLDFAASCLRLDPDYRLTSDELLRHSYFTCDSFLSSFLPEIQKKIQLELVRRACVTQPEAPLPQSSPSFLLHPTFSTSLQQLSQPYLATLPSPLKKTSGWTLNVPMNEASIQEEDRKLSERSLSIEGEQQLELMSQTSRRWGSGRGEEGCLLGVEYRRQMMPSGEPYLRPVRGRLYMDKHAACVMRVDQPGAGQLQRHDSAVCLPLISSMPERRGSEKRNVQQLKRKKSLSKEREKTKSHREVEEINYNFQDWCRTQTALQSSKH